MHIDGSEQRRGDTDRRSITNLGEMIIDLVRFGPIWPDLAKSDWLNSHCRRTTVPLPYHLMIKHKARRKPNA
jgi:hypothetical protein